LDCLRFCEFETATAMPAQLAAAKCPTSYEGETNGTDWEVIAPLLHALKGCPRYVVGSE
jgi:hypothetical protein